MSANDKNATTGAAEVSHSPSSPKVGKGQQSTNPVIAFCQGVANSNIFGLIMFIITIYALFGEDVRVADYGVYDDPTFEILTIIALASFTFELLVSCVGKDDYLWGFFFWLDLVATASLLLDIRAFNESISALFVSNSEDNKENSLKAGRASRAGTRAGRIVRVIRIIRLIRIFKIWKQVEANRNAAKQKQKKQWGRKASEEAIEDMEQVEGQVSESLLSKKMSDMTTRKVIFLVLAMLIALPFFTAASVEMLSIDYGLGILSMSFFAASCSDANQGDSLVNAETCAGLLTHNMNGAVAATSSWELFESQLLLMIYSHVYSTNVKQLGGMSNLVWLDIPDHNRDPPIQLLNSTKYRDQWRKWFVDVEYFEPEKVSDIYAMWDQLTTKGSRLQSPCLKPDGTRQEGVSFFLEADYPERNVVKCPSDLRDVEKVEYSVSTFLPLHKNSRIATLLFSQRRYSSADALSSIHRTLFVCAVLAVGALMFSRDSDLLVLRPIERMIALMRQIQIDPLVATKLGQAEEKKDASSLYSALGAKGRQMGFRMTRLNNIRMSMAPSDVAARAEAKAARTKEKEEKASKKRSRHLPMETVILERTLIKLGNLLALGLGEAGIDIVAGNLKSDRLNAMVPGRHMEAIYGYCEIGSFTVASEVLQERVMVFVNQIAEVLHAICDLHCGAPNKNSGDAFLVVWQIQAGDPDAQSRMSDLALMAFIRTHAAVTKSPVLAEYRQHPGMIARIQNYRVRLGFGLHIGWAIEGAIGSQYKIDASYLSPNVNLTSRLEAATKVYNVPILLSHMIVDVMDKDLRLLLRQIDFVYLPGSNVAVKLYCMDLDTERVQTMPYKSAGIWNQKMKFQMRQVREVQKGRLWTDCNVHRILDHDETIVLLRKKYSQKFFHTFQKGYLNYRAGEWDVAKEAFSISQTMLGDEDGPSSALLEFMKQTVEPPAKWDGKRKLQL